MIRALSLARNIIRINFCLRKSSCEYCRFHYSYQSCDINVDSVDIIIIDNRITNLITKYCKRCNEHPTFCPVYSCTEGYCKINNYMKSIKASKNMGSGVL